MIRATRPLRAVILVASTATIPGVLPALAHHSGAEYDTSKQIQLVGEVKEFHWANPHVWMAVVANDGAGPVRDWHIEAGSVGMMARFGWARAAIKAGDKITVIVNPVRSGEPAGALVKASLADGRALNGAGATPALPLKP